MKTRHTIQCALGFGLAALTPVSAQDKAAETELDRLHTLALEHGARAKP